MNHFTFNGKSTRDFGLIVSGVSIYGAPSRKVEKASVPGRNGDINIELGGFNNYIVRYDVSVTENFTAKAQDIANWLLSSRGYSRLDDTYNADSFRLASYYNQIDFTTSMLYRYGTAPVEFDCHPQRFLLSGQTATRLPSSSYTLTNPTLQPSNPLIRIYGTGTVIVNDVEINVLNSTSYVDVDCEALQCYEGTTNRNNDVEVPVFPVLLAGDNLITYSGDVTRVDITPRWWKL